MAEDTIHLSQRKAYNVLTTIIGVIEKDTEKIEDVTELLLEEAKKIEKDLRIPPLRRIPKRVLLADVEIERNLRSGVKEQGGNLLISRHLTPDKISSVIKREAFILFLPPLDFPHILDLAWAYSNADPSWWSECTAKVSLFTAPYYHAPSIFLSYSIRERLLLIRSIAKAIRLLYSKRGSDLRLEDYLLLVSISRGYPSIRLTRKEIRVLGSLVFVVKSGDAKLENLVKHTGLSLASVSRALRDLISKRVLHGPYAVVPPRIGLFVYLMELVNPSDKEIRFIEGFPYIYNIYVSQRDIYYVHLLIPVKYEKIFSKLSGKGLRVGRQVLFSFDIHSLGEVRPEEVLELMADGYYGAPDTPPSWRELCKGMKPPIKLDKKDLLALSIINDQGKAPRSYLKGIGVPNAAERFARYRENGLVIKGYFPTGVGLGEAIVARFNAPYRDFLRIRGALSKVSSPMMSYTEGALDGITAVIFVNERILGTLVKSLRTLFKDQLIDLEHLLTAGPSNWQIPVELWNEEEQAFEMDVHSFLEAFSPRLKKEVMMERIRNR